MGRGLSTLAVVQRWAAVGGGGLSCRNEGARASPPPPTMEALDIIALTKAILSLKVFPLPMAVGYSGGLKEGGCSCLWSKRRGNPPPAPRGTWPTKKASAHGLFQAGLTLPGQVLEGPPPPFPHVLPPTQSRTSTQPKPTRAGVADSKGGQETPTGKKKKLSLLFL